MEQYEIDEANRELMEKFLERLPPGELISGMVTDKHDDPSAFVWYPVDKDRSQELLRKLAGLGLWRKE